MMIKKGMYLFGSTLGRSNLDDQTGENVIRVVDMRVPLDDKRVAALVADGVESLAFSDDVNLVAGPVQQPVSSQGLVLLGGRRLSHGSQ